MAKEVRHRNSDLVECGVDEYALYDKKPKKKKASKEDKEK
jgi:hypothetical protein